MRISEIARPRTGIPTRRVGVRFTERHRAMTAAMRLWRDLGIDVQIADAEIWLDTPRPLALPAQQILERATGTMGFSEWDRP
jgi:hypothetical protein